MLFRSNGYYQLPLMPREDVAAYFGNSDYVNCGFSDYVRLEGVSEGTYDVSLIIVSGDSSNYYQVNQLFEVVVE